ncbi:MAG: helix-turn-helix domain-containing protein [Steroidobacteraceae bacterium]
MPTNISGVDAKKAREAAFISQAAVAAAVGLNRTYYSLYESGRLDLTSLQSEALVRFLHAHDANEPINVEPAKTQAEQVSEVKRTAQIPLSASRSTRSTRTTHNEPPSLESYRIRTAMQRLIALEQTVAAEQTIGRRVPSSIERTMASLRLLDYSDLFELSLKRGISLATLPSQAEFEKLNPSKRQKVEAQLEQTIVCHAVYGKVLFDCDRNDLYVITCALRKSLPNAGKLVPFPSLLEQVFETDAEAQKTTSRLRSEIMPHLLRSILGRIVIDLPRQ